MVPRAAYSNVTAMNVEPDTGVGGGGVGDLHLVVDDPGLATDLAQRPTGFHAHHRERSGDHGRSKEPSTSGHVSPEDPRRPVPQREQEQKGAEADHDVPAEMHDIDL